MEIGEAQPNSKFIPELDPPDPESVKKYILAQPEVNRGDAYGELVKFLLPEEDRAYRQMDVNDPKNLNFLSLGLQRKQNLEAILNKKNIPDNLTVIFGQLPPGALSPSNNEKLMSFLSPLEQKVLSTASRNKSEVDNFLVKQSLLAIAYNRNRQKENESYGEFVDCFLPGEELLYHQRDVDDPKNLQLMSLALKRKQNLESIINKKKLPDDLRTIINQLPAEVMSEPNNDKLMPFLSPLEQKVLSAASGNESKDVDNFLVKQSLLAIAHNRSPYGMKK